jgi:outer membrane lipoprotein SlyB
MVKKVLSFVLAALFTLSVAGSALAADIKGKVTKTERDGRYVTIKADDGKEARVRISGSSTDLSGVGDRSEIKVGQSVSATYDAGDDRKTASKFAVMK